MKVVRGRDAHLYKRHSSASSYSLSSSSSHSINHYFKKKYKNTCATTATLSSASDHIHRFFKYKYKNICTNTTPFFFDNPHQQIAFIVISNTNTSSWKCNIFNSFSLPSDDSTKTLIAKTGILCGLLNWFWNIFYNL